MDTEVPDDDRLSDHRELFKATMDTVDILMKAKRGMLAIASASAQLEISACAQMNRFVATHGSGRVVPKLHWCMDLADQLRGSDFMMDAFIIERLNLRGRAIADYVDNTAACESSVFAGLVNAQANFEGNVCGLLGATVPYPHPDLQHVQVADRVQLAGKRIAVGDWVHREGEIGTVVACVRERDSLELIVNVGTDVRPVGKRGRLCKQGHGLRSVWKVADTHAVAAWQHVDGEGDALVLMQ